MIRNIIFDMGQVLLHFDTDAFLDRYELCMADRQLLLREIFQSVEWAMMDRGSLEENGLLEIAFTRIPERLHEIARGLVMEWDDPILPVEGMEELIRDLKAAGCQLFLLSNASIRQHEYWPRIPGSEYFTDTLISADVRLVKPQPEVYETAIRKFDVIPEECVFIDDNLLNVEAAQNAGMHGIVFHGDAAELRGKLRALGVGV